jgi:class 3 adenylate cyclase
MNPHEFVARAVVQSNSGESVYATAEVMTPTWETVLWAGSSLASLVSQRESAPEVSRDRILAAVLYTDIVGSTPHAERLGDARWKDLLEEFHERTSKQVTSSRGREVKWTGDGVLAMFDSPARAVQCARALHEAAQRQNIQIRAGIHVGECELMGADVAGIAVHVAQRVLDRAEPGTILVTSTVREAAAGSGLSFADKGRHELKGIEGDWQLYAVED